MNTRSDLAFVFPGQGSQKVGMLAEFYQAEALVREHFAKASDVLGFDLWQLVSEGPDERLNLTENTQPALLTSSVSLYQLWLQRGGAIPALLAGHSLGEWSALVCAGVLRFEDAVNLVRLRGRYMQEAVPQGVGAMAAVIGLEDSAIVSICAESAGDQVVSAVNFNSPGQVVIAGHKEAVERASTALSSAGAKRVLPLPVSAPFHTSLMKPAAERLATDMAAVPFADPGIPVVHNVSADIEGSGEKIRQLMIEQIYSPVRWVDCIQRLSGRATTAVECGPGKVLAGLIKRINKDLVVGTLDSEGSFQSSLGL